MKRKTLYRPYREAKPTGADIAVAGASGLWAPGPQWPCPQGANQRWSLDFVSDALADGRKFRVLCVIDDFSRECLATVADNSLSGERVTRELDRIASVRG